MKVVAHIDIKEAPMSSIATRPHHGCCPRRKRSWPAHGGQTRCRRRLDRKRRRRRTRQARAARRRLEQGLAHWVFDHLVPAGRVLLAGDDTVDGHKGAQVFGKGCHRDPVRSTHSLTVFRWGHKWVVLAVLVRFPFTRRLWALPVLVALYHTEKDNTN